ncbi:hypothetical protein FBUS_04965 [Fasciolopsis buskii]|uniref:Uncharacterized protein n=1 Tax=Fasciolopsis buskii TaxID=27845 RepID=A0A8E0S0S7_9TREM|nr:hypothetical protein FBUS_04965 [Fasciolopsis buski]
MCCCDQRGYKANLANPVCRSMLTQETTNDRFKQYPGFADPFTVVEVCLSVLRSGVYICQNPWKDGSEFDGNLCEGIRMYLEDWPLNPELDRVVNKYVRFPCAMELRMYVNNDQKKALQFLVSYLRKRGPIMHWQIRPGTDEVMGRCMKTVLAGHLQMLTDLEYTSAVMIGRYLQYLISVGYLHNLFYFRTILAKVWGPLFLRPYYSKEYRLCRPLTEEENVNLSITLFDRIIESAPWSTFTPFESVQKAILQENVVVKPYLPDYLRNSIRVQYDPALDKQRVPSHLNGTMSDKFKEEFIKHATQLVKAECPVHKDKGTDERNKPGEAGDNCPQQDMERPCEQGEIQ